MWVKAARYYAKTSQINDFDSVQNISGKRVRQLFSYYKRTGTIPVLRKAGRPRSPDITEYERKEVVRMYGIYRLCCACYLEDVLLAHGIKQGQPWRGSP